MRLAHQLRYVSRIDPAEDLNRLAKAQLSHQLASSLNRTVAGKRELRREYSLPEDLCPCLEKDERTFFFSDPADEEDADGFTHLGL